MKEENRLIAIVDDHTIVRKGLSALIDLFPGYKVLIEAGDGRELIARIEEGLIPHIILLDITMPGMDGFETARWLTVHHPSIKVLALSTMDSEDSILRMLRAGARGYLHKDADPDELKAAFNAVLALGYYYNEYVSRQRIREIGILEAIDQKTGTFTKLTDRERTFLGLACSEKTYNEIAGEMFVSERTVDGYRDALFRKLQVSTRVGLAIYAIRNGLVKI